MSSNRHHMFANINLLHLSTSIETERHVISKLATFFFTSQKWNLHKNSLLIYFTYFCFWVVYGHPVDRNGELHLGYPDALGLPQLLVKLQFSTRLFHHIHALGLVHRSAAQKLPKNTLHWQQLPKTAQKHPSLTIASKVG